MGPPLRAMTSSVMKKLTSIALELTSSDFASQVNEIHQSSFSDYDKRRAFIEIGLCNDDLRTLFGDRYIRPARPLIINVNGRGLTFGVEMECIVARQDIVRSASENGVRIAYEGYNHIDNSSYYKFVTDSSVRATSREDYGKEIECVSPILNYNNSGLDSLKSACKALNEAGAKVNESTGLHVHVGVAGFSGEQIVNIYKNYQKLESLINSFMAPSRRNGRWAKSIASYDFNGCSNAYDVRNAMHCDRYHKVNPCAYERHQTIEFRQHQGSTNYEKVSMWVSFCTKLVAWSASNLLAEEVTDIARVPFLNVKERAFFKARIEKFASR